MITAFSFANEPTNDDFSQEFDSEFSNKSKEIFDPLSAYNRAITTFNDKVYLNVLVPVSKGYAYVVPETARIGIDNFFENLKFPIRFVNNVLQLKFQNSSEELGRFLINSLWGLGGFMDLATSELKMKAHKEDFGQTLGYYGLGEGIPVVLPLLGPSNIRDMIGIVGDGILSPTSSLAQNSLEYKIPNNTLESLGIKTYEVVNNTSLNPDQYETIKKDALDLYPFLRDIYTQSRQKQIEE